jgi:hypothetical protein
MRDLMLAMLYDQFNVNPAHRFRLHQGGSSQLSRPLTASPSSILEAVKRL